jgi:hypothetical protein
MPKAIVRNVVLVAGLVIGAVICGLCANLVISPRGGIGPSVLQADSVLRALVGLGIALAVATVVGCIVGRVNNTAVGMFALGGALFGLAWRMDGIMELAHVGAVGGSGGGSLGLLALETVVVALLIGAATWVVFTVSGPFRDIMPDEDGRVPHWLLSGEALKSVAAAILMIPVVWVMAQTPAKGQAIGSVFVGGMAVGLAGRLLAPHVQPLLVFPAAVLAGAIGHAGAAARVGPLDLAIVNDTLPNLGAPMAVDYAAGACMGVAIGLGWAKSFLHQDEGEAAAPAPA